MDQSSRSPSTADEDVVLSLPRFNLASWTTRVTTNIGSRLRLKFSINKFNIGVMSVNDNSCRFPRDIIQFIQKDFSQLHIDNLIDNYDKTITIKHLKRTFKKWPDIEHDALFVSALDLYLQQLRKMFARAIKRNQLRHSHDIPEKQTADAAKKKIRGKNRVNVIFKRIKFHPTDASNPHKKSSCNLFPHNISKSKKRRRRFEDVLHDEMTQNMPIKRRKIMHEPIGFNTVRNINNNMQFIASNSFNLLQTAAISQNKDNNWSNEEEYGAFQRQLTDILILELVIDYLKAEANKNNKLEFNEIGCNTTGVECVKEE